MSVRPTVLLVEDEWIIAAATSDYLSDAGYDVIEVDRAEVALAILEDRAATIYAVVTDVRLAGPMCGITLAHHARRCWPWLVLMIVSGEKPERLAESPPNCDVLSKPYFPEEILNRLQARPYRPAQDLP